MHSKTTVAISSDFESDRLWLNGVEESVDSNPRLVNCLREVRTRAKGNKVKFWSFKSPNNVQKYFVFKIILKYIIIKYHFKGFECFLKISLKLPKFMSTFTICNRGSCGSSYRLLIIQDFEQNYSNFKGFFYLTLIQF